MFTNNQRNIKKYSIYYTGRARSILFDSHSTHVYGEPTIVRNYCRHWGCSTMGKKVPALKEVAPTTQ